MWSNGTSGHSANNEGIMPHMISFVDDALQSAHYEFVLLLKDFAVANGWTVLRYDTSTADHELILKGVGLSGLEEIFVGWKTKQNADADYYNIVAGVFTGYVPGNTFETQPLGAYSAFCAHNQRIDFWLTLNAQRITFVLKLGTPVYEACYVGKFLPYARPSQYPYPVTCAGTLGPDSTLRFSDISTKHAMPYTGGNARMMTRHTSGWSFYSAWPWSGTAITGPTYNSRDTEGERALSPIILHSTANLWGELDGIFHVSGFNIVVEDTFVVGGVTHVAIQDVFRTGFSDYFALRLDA